MSFNSPPVDGAGFGSDPARVASSSDRHSVTAVLVAHNGERWLPRVLDGLANQVRPVQRILAVDTGSVDSSTQLLTQRSTGARTRLFQQPASTGFGAAVAHALASAGPTPASPGATEWVWLLHDDCQPAPDALFHLLDAADELAAAGRVPAVIGPKLRNWYRRRQLLEVGTTISRGGRRETGLERGEEDQGQQDFVRDVLSVSSAGMLVRRDVWDELGGFDPRLPLVRDDLDFCWRANQAGHRVVVAPNAVMYHAEAAVRERRTIDCAVDRPHRLDREHAMYALLVNSAGWTLPWLFLRLLLTTLLRVAGYLVAKMPGYAADEALAMLRIALRPDQVLVGRVRRRRTRRVSAGQLRPLLPSLASQARYAVETVYQFVASRTPDVGAGTAGSHRAAVVASGPTDEEAEALETESWQALRQLLRRPVVLLSTGLVLLTLVAVRSLIGAGSLTGGALLPAHDSYAQLWNSYLQSWQPVGVGSTEPAAPYLAVMGVLATLLVGQPGLAVDLLLLGAVPLAGITAYLAVRRITTSRWVRIWAAASYALLPGVTGAVAQGRLGTVVFAVLLPLIGLAAARLISPASAARDSWWTGLLLAVATAFNPFALVLAAVLAGLGLLLPRSLPYVVDRAHWRRIAVALTVPLALLLPWSLGLLRHPSRFLFETGVVTPGLTDLRWYDALLLNPGGPGRLPLGLTAGLLVAGLVGLLRYVRRPLAVIGWTLALTGYGTAVVLGNVGIAAPQLSHPQPPWPGTALVLAGAGVVLAATVTAHGARERLAARSFGLFQVGFAGLAALAVLTPVLTAAAWALRGADTPLTRGEPVALPAYVAAESQSQDQPRTLVIRQYGSGLSYAVMRENGARLGDSETTADLANLPGLEQNVAELAAGTGGEQTRRLAEYAVRYVYVTRPVSPELARTLDSTAGLVRVSASGGAALWKIALTSVRPARLKVLAPGGATQSAVDSVAASGADGARLAPGPAGRKLLLAETAAPGWTATLDGQPLTRTTVAGWAQGFELPAGGGVLRIGYHSWVRTGWLVGQGLLLLIVLVLSLPDSRRQSADEELYEEEGEEAQTPPVGVSAPLAPPATGLAGPAEPVVPAAAATAAALAAAPPPASPPVDLPPPAPTGELPVVTADHPPPAAPTEPFPAPDWAAPAAAETAMPTPETSGQYTGYDEPHRYQSPPVPDPGYQPEPSPFPAVEPYQTGTHPVTDAYAAGYAEGMGHSADPYPTSGYPVVEPPAAPQEHQGYQQSDAYAAGYAEGIGEPGAAAGGAPVDATPAEQPDLYQYPAETGWAPEPADASYPAYPEYAPPPVEYGQPAASEYPAEPAGDWTPSTTGSHQLVGEAWSAREPAGEASGNSWQPSPTGEYPAVGETGSFPAYQSPYQQPADGAEGTDRQDGDEEPWNSRRDR